MNEPKDLVLKLEESALSIEVDIREVKLIGAILSALVVYVEEQSPLRITQSFSQILSKSQSIVSTIMWKGKEMLAWADDSILFPSRHSVTSIACANTTSG